ncbi:hypothetical protein [Hymenobacter glacieicola]|uniref:Uncharacterized protein n=1 Tax=Hymenobacter glacieicola TaxID=1562124 RepID=A0ABQ1X2D7_9BACT|nr:hypothetical protein [Hymenobacter glacieicola]GGG56522.1 hypothetical protein GCM10011378_35880 [Hymenobacter glacieicola]
MANDQNTPQPDQQGGNSATPTTPKQPATTQEELLNDSGAGIRGGYGDSDQTNGLEGGGQTKSDRSDIQQSAQE